MKRLSVCIVSLLMTTVVFADTPATCTPGTPTSSQAYQAVQWARDSAEHNAIYREVFLLGQAAVKKQVHKMHLKPQQWGVVMDIDETVLDNSALFYQGVLKCQGYSKTIFSPFEVTGVSIATPGAVAATCGIQKMGGYVTLISNRDGSYVDPTTQQTMMQATVKNLKKVGICFNQVILASNSSDWDKNARFTAARTGIYPPGMIYSNTLPAHPILAYFGDNIQDFPNLQQGDMIKQDPNGAAYDPFGKIFFALPNPMYGSWLKNAFQ